MHGDLLKPTHLLAEILRNFIIVYFIQHLHKYYPTNLRIKYMNAFIHILKEPNKGSKENLSVPLLFSSFHHHRAVQN